MAWIVGPVEEGELVWPNGTVESVSFELMRKEYESHSEERAWLAFDASKGTDGPPRFRPKGKTPSLSTELVTKPFGREDKIVIYLRKPAWLNAK